MRIHTDTLTPSDFSEAARVAGCQVITVTRHRSTARGHAFDFIVTGHGRHGGAYGGVDYAVGSWDDYGIMLAELFRRDPRAIVGTPGRPTYAGADDFHAETAYRYETLTPAEAHHAHRRDRRSGHREDRYVTEAGRYLTRCRGTRDQECDAYI
jgi:hypothetical protein